MSSFDRPIDGKAFVRHLKQDEKLIDRALVERHGRSSRTLVKEGPLRLTLVELGPGGELAPHRAPGPATMHVLEGTVVFTALGQEYPVAAGEILVMEGGVEHSGRSASGGVFLLTVVDAR